MATRYFINAGTAWNNNANWSTTSGGAGPASFPTSADAAIFDTNSGNCTLTTDASCLSATFTSYPNTFNAGGFNFTIGTGGFTGSGISGTCTMGSGTWTCVGDYINNKNVFATVNYNTSTLVLTGSGVNLDLEDRYSYNLTINGTVTLVGGHFSSVANHFQIESGKSLAVNGASLFVGQTNTINGSLTLIAGNIYAVDKTFTIGASGNLNATFLSMRNPVIDNSAGGTCNLGTTNIQRSVSLSGGTYGGNFTLDTATTVAQTITLGNGSGQTVVFTGDITIFSDASETYTINMNTHNPDVVFAGDLTLSGAGTKTVNAGTGTVSFTGSSATVNVGGRNFGDVEIDSAGTVTLLSDLAADDFTLTDGTLDLDVYDLDCTTYTQGQATDVTADVTTPGRITTSGNFTINGASGNPCTFGYAQVACSGTGTAHYTTVTDSDASFGNAINATDNCTGVGTNTNWTFGSGYTPQIPILVSLLSAADGSAITNPAGAWHNKAKTKINFTPVDAPWKHHANRRGAITLNGSQTQPSVLSAISGQIGTAMSVLARVKGIVYTGGYQYVFGADNGTSTEACYFGIDTTGQVIMYCGTEELALSGVGDYIALQGSYTDLLWTVDSPSEEGNLYINGTITTQSPAPTNGNLFDWTSGLTRAVLFGHPALTPANKLIGSVARLTIYPAVITPAQVDSAANVLDLRFDWDRIEDVQGRIPSIMYDGTTMTADTITMPTAYTFGDTLPASMSKTVASGVKEHLFHWAGPNDDDNYDE